SGWIADYPDPENFLSLFYGKSIKSNNSTLNPFKYNNDEFDKYFEQAMVEQDPQKRMELYAKCDQLLVDDAVVMPLMTQDLVTMTNVRVHNFKTNSMRRMDFGNIYIKDLK